MSGILVRHPIFEVDEADTELFSQHSDELGFGDGALGHQQIADAPTVGQLLA